VYVRGKEKNRVQMITLIARSPCPHTRNSRLTISTWVRFFFELLVKPLVSPVEKNDIAWLYPTPMMKKPRRRWTMAAGEPRIAPIEELPVNRSVATMLNSSTTADPTCRRPRSSAVGN
jgi:hypothetical protein